MDEKPELPAIDENEIEAAIRRHQVKLDISGLAKVEGREMAQTWKCFYCKIKLPMSIERCECGQENLAPTREEQLEKALGDLIVKLGDRSYDDYDDVSWFDELKIAKILLSR